MVDRSGATRLNTLMNLPLRTPSGAVVKLSQVADVAEEPGQMELQRDDLRQDVVVSARLEDRDLGSAMAEIRELLSKDTSLPPGTVEFGGLYQQQESFRNLMVVLALAVLLVFTVLLIEFRSFFEPLAIIFGAVLSTSGAVLALRATGTTLNVMSILGTIIGIGIVAKNGILMLDCVKQQKKEQPDLNAALVRSGRRRLRPVLMTSLAAALGMFPLAYGLGAGSDMLRPLAIAVIGSLCISVLLSLVATPVLYSVLITCRGLFVSQKKADSVCKG
jgi:multidrug efflux pump subunit AcrB